MALGLTDTQANAWLNTLRGTAYSVATPYVKLHTGDPGATGTANASAETLRKLVGFNAPSADAIALTAAVSWTAWSVGNETLTHVSLWDHLSAGNCLWTGILSAGKAMTNGDTFTLSTLTVGLTTSAA